MRNERERIGNCGSALATNINRYASVKKIPYTKMGRMYVGGRVGRGVKILFIQIVGGVRRAN